MDVAFVIRRRLDELGLEQRDLARAAQVTESYISQLLGRKKPPPAPNRTDIYERMESALKLSGGELVRLAELQRKEELRRELEGDSAPLFAGVRELVLRKCARGKQSAVRAVFERQPFGELERLVTEKLLEVVKGVARAELDNEAWLRMVAELSGLSYEETRVIVLEFLDTDVLELSSENCVTFLDPLVESWDLDLASFALSIVLNPRVVSGRATKVKFEFIERGSDSEPSLPEEPGFEEFLQDPSLSGTATAEELEFLKQLRFRGRRPTPLYYYRELQNLRDPLHFGPSPTPPQPPRGRPSGSSPSGQASKPPR